MAFHPYPQVIPHVFNHGGFGPPRGLTRASPWPWVDHSASGLEHATRNALFGLAFAPAPPHGLTSPHTVTRRLILQKARHRGHRSDDALTACKPTVSGTISLPSRGTFHLSLTVLVHYRSPELYLALRGGPRRFTRNFPGPVLLGDTARRPITFRVRDCYPLRSEFP